MAKYRKIPVEIEAMPLTVNSVDEAALWCGGRVVREVSPTDHNDVYTYLEIPTLEGIMRAETTDSSGRYPYGDFLIKGMAGEFHPCKPDIFWMIYEEVLND